MDVLVWLILMPLSLPQSLGAFLCEFSRRGDAAKLQALLTTEPRDAIDLALQHKEPCWVRLLACADDTTPSIKDET